MCTVVCFMNKGTQHTKIKYQIPTLSRDLIPAVKEHSKLSLKTYIYLKKNYKIIESNLYLK